MTKRKKAERQEVTYCVNDKPCDYKAGGCVCFYGGDCRSNFHATLGKEKEEKFILGIRIKSVLKDMGRLLNITEE